MKYILLLFVSFAVQAKVFTISATWDCNRLTMPKETAKLPKSTNLKIRINTNKSTVTIRPDIFNGIDFNGKDSIVNSNSCFKKLIKKVNSGISKYVKKCKNCNFNSETIKTNFNTKLASSDYLKKTNVLSKIPRVYSGHTDSTSISSIVLLNKLCSNKKLSSKEIIAVAGLNFVYQMSDRIAEDKNAFNKNCIRRLEKIQDRFKVGRLDCKSYSCTQINKKLEIRKDLIAKLHSDFEYAQNKEDIKNLSDNGFKLADTATELNILKNHLSKDGKCSVNHAVKTKTVFESVYRYDNVISKLIDSDYKRLNQECIRTIVRSYIRSKEFSSSDDIEDCQSDYCKSRRSVYHQNIVKLMNMSHTKKQVEAFCKEPPKSRDFKTFEDMWDKLDDITMCTELKIGESRPLINKSTSGIPNYHALKRVSEKKYEATLAINFNSKDQKANEEMRQRVNSCISKTSGYFKSPNGEQMDVKIISKSDNQKLKKQERLEVVNINIAEKGGYFRSNSKHYAADISCATITHELLHLMGLVDEYHENTTQALYNADTKEAYNPKYFPDNRDIKDFKSKTAYVECRSHSKENSVMSNQRARFADSVKSKVSCKCETEECINFMKNDKVAKLANFRTPNDYNINRHCKSTTKKSIRLKDDYIPSDKLYTDTTYSENYLSFVSPDLSFGSKHTRIKDPSLRFVTTTCNCSTDECKRDIASYKKNIIDNNVYNTRRFCPYGAPSVKDRAKEITSSDDPQIHVEDDGIYTFTTTPKNNSLLMPAHFEKMKWGSCSTKATNYNKCASYAYQLVGFQCEDKPKFCESDKGWLQSIK